MQQTTLSFMEDVRTYFTAYETGTRRIKVHNTEIDNTSCYIIEYIAIHYNTAVPPSAQVGIIYTYSSQ